MTMPVSRLLLLMMGLSSLGLMKGRVKTPPCSICFEIIICWCAKNGWIVNHHRLVWRSAGCFCRTQQEALNAKTRTTHQGRWGKWLQIFKNLPTRFNSSKVPVKKSESPCPRVSRQLGTVVVLFKKQQIYSLNSQQEPATKANKNLSRNNTLIPLPILSCPSEGNEVIY